MIITRFTESVMTIINIRLNEVALNDPLLTFMKYTTTKTIANYNNNNHKKSILTTKA